MDEATVIIEKKIKEKEKEKNPILNEKKTKATRKEKLLWSREAGKHLLTYLFVWFMNVIGYQLSAMAESVAIYMSATTMFPTGYCWDARSFAFFVLRARSRPRLGI